MFYITVKLCQPKKLHILAEGAIGQFAGFPDLNLPLSGFFARAGVHIGCTADTPLNSLHVCTSPQKGSNSMLSHYGKTGLNVFAEISTGCKKDSRFWWVVATILGILQ